jgi:hypothetical protein
VKRSEYAKKGVSYLLGTLLSVFVAFQLVIVGKPNMFTGLTPVKAGLLTAFIWFGCAGLAVWTMCKGTDLLFDAKHIGRTLHSGIIVGYDSKMGLDGMTPRLKLVDYRVRAFGFEGWRLRRRIVIEKQGWIVVSKAEYDSVVKHCTTPGSRIVTDASNLLPAPGMVFCRQAAPPSGSTPFQLRRKSL